jgi:hypothetical protein
VAAICRNAMNLEKMIDRFEFSFVHVAGRSIHKQCASSPLHA